MSMLDGIFFDENLHVSLPFKDMIDVVWHPYIPATVIIMKDGTRIVERNQSFGEFCYLSVQIGKIPRHMLSGKLLKSVEFSKNMAVRCRATTRYETYVRVLNKSKI